MTRYSLNDLIRGYIKPEYQKQIFIDMEGVGLDFDAEIYEGFTSAMRYLKLKGRNKELYKRIINEGVNYEWGNYYKDRKYTNRVNLTHTRSSLYSTYWIRSCTAIYDRIVDECDVDPKHEIIIFAFTNRPMTRSKFVKGFDSYMLHANAESLHIMKEYYERPYNCKSFMLYCDPFGGKVIFRNKIPKGQSRKISDTLKKLKKDFYEQLEK